jgi:hypothetical protein
MKKILTIASVGLLMVASCAKTELKENNEGMGMLTVDMSIPSQTRAYSEADLYNSAVVNIYKADFSGLVRSYAYNDIPSPLYLAADSYRVDVIAGEATAANPAAASWENKSYKGSKEFTITAGRETSVQVVASVNNAVTNITFDPSIAENFNAGYTFTIGLDASSQLVYNAAKSGAEGYFIVAGLVDPVFEWTFAGTLLDGTSFTRTGTISDVLPGKLYKMNLMYTVKDGKLDFSLSVDYSTEIIDDTIIFEPVSTGLAASSPFEIWAKRATVHADVDASESEGKSIQFSYSSNGSNWTTVDGVNDSEGTWKAELTGLVPSTQYSYRLLIDGTQVGDELTFTTEAAPAIPNGSFEYTSKVTGQSFDKFYDPSCGVEEGMYKFWASGNGDEQMDGSASMSTVITVVDTNEKYDGKQSVCAQSQNAAGIGMLAAGNLFTGQFAGLVGTEGGKVNFGRPWTSRPAAMTLYCKYTTDKMNLIKNHPDGMTLTSDMYDRAQIKVAVGNWDYRTYGGTPDSPVLVNTTDSKTFVDFAVDNSTIAYGELTVYNDGYTINRGTKVSGSTEAWVEYTIPLDYSKVDELPTHIIISCAASQYGDYFTGYSKSKLWLDAFELIY